MLLAKRLVTMNAPVTNRNSSLNELANNNKLFNFDNLGLGCENQALWAYLVRQEAIKDKHYGRLRLSLFQK